MFEKFHYVVYRRKSLQKTNFPYCRPLFEVLYKYIYIYKLLQAYTPTGFEKYGYTCTVADYRVSFSVWDTSGKGNPLFAYMTKSFNIYLP